MGAGDLDKYEEKFSSFSAEQVALRWCLDIFSDVRDKSVLYPRKEEYQRCRCAECGGLFWSRHRLQLHKRLGFCDAAMVASIRSVDM